MELEIKNLTKNYGKKQALKGLNVTLTEGVYGFLGPNGAGKSTFMNILTGNLKATSGQILYNGEEITRLGRSFRGILGYMPQQQALYPNFTATGFLSYIAALRDMKKDRAKERIPKVLSQVGLSDVADDKIRSFSGGMKQRLLIAQAVLDEPKILVLDEPTAGLDPKQRIAIRNLISEISAAKIVIIATHVVTDVESVANRILLIREGEMLADSTREELNASLSGHVWELQVPEEQLEEVIGRDEYLIGNIAREGKNLFVRVISDKEPEDYAFMAVRPGLEDVYLYYFKE
ncbi:ATP-binding cassette domain-containing protein [Lacrimispora sp. NSJ-141]|uniref:ATP-binding cassette domain-containing protein n=1 Tax=Lientehia hominis TaxID=2897778 RepID=A0AAP2RKM2_9FIRM|nr:ATP-binding cassette domain-containing protein [Lientehia hominis]MCD2493726.1 ATP-binding cassette domain-containing protein [Lientehia hominis]